ncbi:MAG: S-layer homology domain-containing protein, partial [Firmicutes bacterium]|nr:S-layer homology domain-containing protein [Bacillota bacterium]
LDDDHLTASFGNLNVTENGADDRKYVFTVDDNPDYDIQVKGTGSGEMNFTITYYEGDDAVYHKFVNVPLTAKTVVTTSPTDRSEDFEIYVDRNGDGKTDITAAAGEDDTVYLEGGVAYTYKDTGKGTHYAVGSDGSYFTEEHHFENDICVECGAYNIKTRGYAESDEPSVKPAPQPQPQPEPEPQPEPASDLPFADVRTADWFNDSVKYAYENGMMQGLSADVFGPNVTLSRAMLVTILYRLDGSPAVIEANPFNDVADGQWYTNAVIWANANNIVNGYGNGSFGPLDDITREQMAAMLMRYAAYKGNDTSARADLSGYADLSAVSAWALEALQWANAEGLITGRTGNVLAPADPTTRAETATILMRYCGN